MEGTDHRKFRGKNLQEAIRAATYWGESRIRATSELFKAAW